MKTEPSSLSLFYTETGRRIKRSTISLHVAVNSGRNHFEPDNLEDAGLDALRHRFRNEVQYVVDLIDALLKEEALYQR